MSGYLDHIVGDWPQSDFGICAEPGEPDLIAAGLRDRRAVTKVSRASNEVDLLSTSILKRSGIVRYMDQPPTHANRLHDRHRHVFTAEPQFQHSAKPITKLPHKPHKTKLYYTLPRAITSPFLISAAILIVRSGRAALVNDLIPEAETADS
jgi:hypothetical protein